MVTRETIYNCVRESLPRAEQGVVDFLIREIEKSSVMQPERDFEKNAVDRVIKLCELKALGLIDV